MVKHMILWKLKEDLTLEEKRERAKEIKEGLEGLQSHIQGLLKISVVISGLSSSNADIMLDSTFEDETALKNYAIHPLHVEVADNKVRPYVQTRLCMDYLI